MTIIGPAGQVIAIVKKNPGGFPEPVFELDLVKIPQGTAKKFSINNDYLVKPINVEEVTKAIRRSLEIC
ncbi:MAG: hypothetical protein HQ512_08520 [Rhodospirillales bacterium]|nr:hypothetical protein [Rhodospirillales bacterium]